MTGFQTGFIHPSPSIDLAFSIQINGVYEATPQNQDVNPWRSTGFRAGSLARSLNQDLHKPQIEIWSKITNNRKILKLTEKCFGHVVICVNKPANTKRPSWARGTQNQPSNSPIRQFRSSGNPLLHELYPKISRNRQKCAFSVRRTSSSRFHVL